MRFTGAAETTILTRTRVLRRVQREVGDPLTLSKHDLIGFLSAYDVPSTRSTVLAYLRAFYAWAVREDLIESDPTSRIPTVKVPNAAPRPAGRDDVQRLLSTAEPRTRAMALLMVYAGLRCCEVAGFRHEHVTREPDGGTWVQIPRSKGGHQQSVPLPADVADEVLAAPAWTVGAQSVQKIVSAALKAAGSRATPHQLRHYYGTTALHSTQNLRQVQEMMRHSSPATTARYTAVSSHELSNAAENLPRIEHGERP